MLVGIDTAARRSWLPKAKSFGDWKTVGLVVDAHGKGVGEMEYLRLRVIAGHTAG
jgi:hypothetical protein